MDLLHQSSSRFTWRRPKNRSGFVFESSAVKTSLNACTLMPVLTIQPSAEFETYEPLNVATALYRVLAATSPTPDGVVEFAEEYGFLGVGMGEVQGRPMEPLESWEREIVQMEMAVRVWDMVREGKDRALGEYVRWHGGRVESLMGSRLARAYGDTPSDPEVARVLGWTHPSDRDLVVASVEIGAATGPIPKGDIIQAGRLQLLELVNGALNRGNGPMLLWDPERMRTRLWLRPSCLLSAAYLQLGLAIAGNCEPRECATCGRPFDVRPAASRTDRKTCSNACRSKGYRSRHQAGDARATKGKR
jgi:hypothetical protein